MGRCSGWAVWWGWSDISVFLGLLCGTRLQWCCHQPCLLLTRDSRLHWAGSGFGVLGTGGYWLPSQSSSSRAGGGSGIADVSIDGRVESAAAAGRVGRALALVSCAGKTVLGERGQSRVFQAGQFSRKLRMMRLGLVFRG